MTLGDWPLFYDEMDRVMRLVQLQVGSWNAGLQKQKQRVTIESESKVYRLKYLIMIE